MCLSKRSALRHIDPKAQTERWDIFDRLSKRSELRHIDPKARIERWDRDNLNSLSKRRYDSLEKEF